MFPWNYPKETIRSWFSIKKQINEELEYIESIGKATTTSIMKKQ